MSPSMSPTPSPTASPEEPGKGGGTDVDSPTPSVSPEPEQPTLPQTGAEALGGLGAAGTIGAASYQYYRSKRRVLDALRNK